MTAYFRDRRILYLSVMLAVLFISAIAVIRIHSSEIKELDSLRGRQKEIVMLKNEFFPLRTRIDALERKKSLTKVNGVVSAVEDIFSTLGLRSKIKSIKPLGSRDVSGEIEEDAEVTVEKITMNEIVNLFYRIDNAPILLVLKKADIKTSFERPELLNLTIMISLVHGK
ncbi:MAG: hypothetical protein HY755_07480 [Nitrospirae bacterium]|nr:hypothetical protein [Nitrospirota bacterium]